MGYPTNSNNSNNDRADGFGNAVIKDLNGNEHKFRKGLVLQDKNVLERSILNKARAAAEKGETYTFTAEITVHLVTDTADAADIAL